jgi:putative peptide zinc metalloprotease protein
VAIPRLRDDVQLLVGMDDQPLAYDGATGRYHRLSGSAVATLRLLDGTRTAEEVAAALAATRRQERGAAQAELEAFLGALDRAGLLDREAASDQEGTVGSRVSQKPLRRRRRSLLLPRFVVTRRLPQLIEPLAVRLRPGRRASALMAGLVIAGTSGFVIGVTEFFHTSPSTRWDGSAAVAGLVFLSLVCVHEAAHALVCQIHRVPIRGAGFALLFWLLPVAYVDRTDAYRIRPRPARVALALAGPLCDGVFMGVTAVVAMGTGSYPARVAAHLLAFQMLALTINVNPLLPSDCYVAVEAGFGLVDPRGRALSVVWHTLRRRPLPLHLRCLPTRTRSILLGYGLACVAYSGLLVFALITAVTSLVARVAGAG